MNFEPLKYIYLPSENAAAYTLLLLHGTGGNERDLIPLAENFGKEYNILSLRGNVSEHGMPRFFKRLGMGVFDEQDLDFRTDEMVAFIKSIADKEGFDITKLIALGYSNGANIAGATLIKYPDFLAGVILYRPMQPFREIKSVGTDNNVPVFFSSGRLDPTVNPNDTQTYLNNLKGLGFAVDYHDIPTGHNLTADDIKLTAQWLVTSFK
ncbi:alpha/beta hydrolase [Flavobacterium beibuense]|uniref:Phospholipase/carboxylesterase n=1 Tax=Flavobacterium beibuense TaxID=657326 RepID=A0A444WIW8_9FLAO|nr:alpha/beta hydrolase [Flavobacterium beibuense]RYJ45818.1 Phospholipase/carboxylesterase [Flavobacterium beibuense]